MTGGASVNIADVRTLDDVLARDTAPLALLIIMVDLGPAKTRVATTAARTAAPNGRA